MTTFFQALVNAVTLGSVYALIAVGIGLVFGVMRLINFAYGQLIMIGAFTLAVTIDWPVALSIVMCFVVVVAASLVMEVTVFRPLRSASAATMLVATFAVAFLLQSIALVKFGTFGKPVNTLGQLNRAFSVGDVDIRYVSFLALGVTVVALVALLLLLNRTPLGLHVRAASADPLTARLLGVRADVVITAAVVISGILAAAVAVVLAVQFPIATSDYGLRETIIVLVGVVVGGIDRLWSATLGGFVVGFATGMLGEILPSGEGGWPLTRGVYLDSAIFLLVIGVLLLRPVGLFGPRGGGGVERV
jgi:branched-chain amino acid transport system permease protein